MQRAYQRVASLISLDLNAPDQAWHGWKKLPEPCVSRFMHERSMIFTTNISTTTPMGEVRYRKSGAPFAWKLSTRSCLAALDRYQIARLKAPCLNDDDQPIYGRRRHAKLGYARRRSIRVIRRPLPDRKEAL